MLNGSIPPVGTVVDAYMGNIKCGSGQTTSSGSYVIDVDSGYSVPGCGTPGAVVTFKIAGVTAQQTGTFKNGNYEQLNLTATGGASGINQAALSLGDPRPCIPEPGQTVCDATRKSLWNGEKAAWDARGVTDPDARFNETVVMRVRAGDPAVISIIAKFLSAPYLQVTRVKFIGTGAGQADEYVEVSNLGGGSQDMSGWTLRSPARNLKVAFPSGFVMNPSQTCRIYTGTPQADACSGMTFNSTDVWPDDQGEIVLYYDALDLLGADTRYSADPNNQPPPPNLQAVS
jgi:hypothetical protein